MKIPQKPPAFKPEDLFSMTPTEAGMLSQFSSGMLDGSYIHWDKLRRKPMPENLTPKQLWKLLKFMRILNLKPIPLTCTKGDSFNFALPDPVLEMLHHIDQDASGRVEMPDPIANEHTRDRYLISSLIEEAIRSSQLEGAATTRRVAKEMLRSKRKPVGNNETMIWNNFQTMKFIVEQKERKLTPELLFNIHHRITENTLENPDAAGRFRYGTEPVKVFDRVNPGEVLHSPPPAEQLPERLQAMCDFANGNSQTGFIHPVIRAIILHFWLAYDHPFVDGNGRTARALFYWSMLKDSYWLCEFLSISSIFRNAPSRYARAFLYTETDDNDLTYFIIYHLEAIQTAIKELHAYLKRKAAEVKQLERQSSKFIGLNHRQRALISHALRHPDTAFTIESHRSSHRIVYETARRDLMDLEHSGLLRSVKVKNRLYFYPAHDLEKILE